MPLTLQNTLNWTAPFVRLQPLTGLGGIATEPAVTTANTVKQLILSPPFAWRWNRSTISTNLVAGQQDYVQSAPDFGWIEKATVVSGAQVFEVENKTILPDVSEQGRPIHVAAQMDDGAGDITFRVCPAPDTQYTLKITYQKAPTSFAALTDKWAPIPDYLSYIFSNGFLAYSLLLVDDPRAQGAMEMFLRSLVSTSDGLTDTEKDLFIGERLQQMRQQQNALRAK